MILCGLRADYEIAKESGPRARDFYPRAGAGLPPLVERPLALASQPRRVPG